MTQVFKVSEIFDKNVNFLIGSGASFGLLPTLEVLVKDANDQNQTIETLATHFENSKKDNLKALLFMHYYKECIKPAYQLDLHNLDGKQASVLENYETFLSTVLSMLARSNSSIRKCNIFTTNYDGCFEAAADNLLQLEGDDFVLNDGSRGFLKKFLHARNYNSFMQKTGLFEKSISNVPQINLVHLHGSVFWDKEDTNIIIRYNSVKELETVDNYLYGRLNEFSDLLLDRESRVEDLERFESRGIRIRKFWEEYNKLPIVNPTKWKFYETVFEQHYYQMLRLLSYELEKPNAVLICFGFSFADEHILQLVQRSLSNPSLQIFVCCFDSTEESKIQSYFSGYQNVVPIATEESLDFALFNSEIFTTKPPSPVAE